MLSLFPSLLFLAPLSALVIRAVVACFFALAAYTHTRNAGASPLLYTFAVLECVTALSLALGYWAQAGALLGVLLVVLSFILPRARPYPTNTLILMLVMCLSILVTGPGAFAFDLPL